MNTPPQSGEWASSFDIPVRNVAEDAPQVVAPRPPAKMSIVLPFIEREVPQVLRLLDWMTKLSGQLKRTLYLLPFKGISGDAQTFEPIRQAALRAFIDVQVIADNEGVTSDWRNDEKVRDAAGPNSLFRQAAWFFHFKPELGPWFWLEPDCTPLTADWDEAIETEYRRASKPFMGVAMKWLHGGADNGLEYLNGAAVYPQNLIARAAQMVTRTMWKQFPTMEIGFDVAGGAAVVRQAHLTDLIQLDYRAIDPRPREGAVLFHGDREQLLIDKLLNAVPVLAEPGLTPCSSRRETPATNGEARESTKIPMRESAEDGDSRGGAQKSSKRKRAFKDGDGLTVVGPPFPKVPPGEWREVEIGGTGIHGVKCTCLEKDFPCPFHFRDNQTDPLAPETVGDQIRHHVSALVAIGSNSNRRTRILAALRKTNLLPRIAR